MTGDLDGTGDEERLRRLLGGPETAWILERARARLERDRPLEGTITRPDATDGERLAVARLVGRAVPAGRSTSLSLDRLDEVLRSSGAWPAGLASAIVALTGPVADPRVREEEQRAWASVTAELMALADLRSDLAEWLEGLRARGQLRRVAGSAEEASVLIAQLRAVVAALPAPGESIARFSARVLDRAHALDAGTPLGGLAVAVAEVLGRAAAGGGTMFTARSGSAAWRRDVWAGVGVVVDDLSSTVLALGLPGSPSASGTAAALAHLAAQGQPVVLTLRQVTADDVGSVSGVVYVCENPAVVAAAADALGNAAPPLVCLQGQPSAAAVLLLRQLAARGASVRYHGDFDWGGVVIARALAKDVDWRPWRYDADAYEDALRLRGDSLPVLTGAPLPTPWDPRLAEVMRARGVSVEEEVVIDALIGDLGDRA